MHPAFLTEITSLLGNETPAFLDALEKAPTLALRVNTLRLDAFRHAAPFISDAVPWAPNCFYLKEGERPGRALAHDLGAYYLQEASAMISASVLDARPGERILDLCAAPGGKTGQISAALSGRGLLVSNEPVPNRAKLLAENLERLGVVNAVAVSAYPQQLADRWGPYFDAVLVDAPCSGEGMFRREPASRDEWQPGSPEGCARRQADILDSAAKLVRPGGRLIYSTCTFNHYENEGSISSFLDRHPEFSACDFEVPGIGRSHSGCIRIWPHRVRGDGHFAAKLIKSADAPETTTHSRTSRRRKPPVPEESVLVERLSSETCTPPEVLTNGKLIKQGDYVHLLPPETPDLETIRVVKPGLCLLRAGRSHVQPMPALARACDSTGTAPWMARARRIVEVDEDTALRLRSGERLVGGDGKRSWALIIFEGLPLCWQKL